jgi:hypothetical protein
VLLALKRVVSLAKSSSSSSMGFYGKVGSWACEGCLSRVSEDVGLKEKFEGSSAVSKDLVEESKLNTTLLFFLAEPAGEN